MQAREPVPKPRRERVRQAARDITEDPGKYENQKPNATFEGLEPDNMFDGSDDGDE